MRINFNNIFLINNFIKFDCNYFPQGPFVHIASMVARSMGKFVASFKGIYTVRRNVSF